MVMKKLKRLRPEVFILILLIFCITYVIHYDQQTGRAGAALVIDQNEQVSIVHVKSEIVKQQKSGREVHQYKPDACQLARIYDSDLNPVFSISFTDNDAIYKYIDADTSLTDLYLANKSGSTNIDINDVKYRVDYAWENANGTRYLIVYVNSKSESHGLSSFMVMIYLTLILILTLFINTLYWSYRDVTDRYRQAKREANSRIL